MVSDILIMCGVFVFIFGPIFVVHGIGIKWPKRDSSRVFPSRKINQIINGGATRSTEPTPDRCHLTEQIHAAARNAGLCLDCGETREKCGGFMPDVLPGTPRAPRWVCGVERQRFKTVVNAYVAMQRENSG